MGIVVFLVIALQCGTAGPCNITAIGIQPTPMECVQEVQRVYKEYSVPDDVVIGCMQSVQEQV